MMTRMMINNLNSLQTRTNVAGILTRSYVLLAEAASLLEQPSDPVADRQAKEQLTTAIRWQISALVNLLHYNTKTTPSAAIQQMRQAHTQLHSAVETLERRSQPRVVAAVTVNVFSQMLNCLNLL